MFAVAVDALESEKCPHCGVPAWHAYSEDNTIAFKRKEIKCEACAHEARESKDEKLGDGVRMVVYAVPEDGFELPTREDFFKKLAAKAELEAEREAAKKASTE